jgi:hypothetical protein
MRLYSHRRLCCPRVTLVHRDGVLLVLLLPARPWTVVKVTHPINYTPSASASAQDKDPRLTLPDKLILWLKVR